ncbi:poly hydrolase [Flagelloscypha sp. PMI_526]|nr:poly hydrolase [Flagelloscypha sp. PMI_526]
MGDSPSLNLRGLSKKHTTAQICTGRTPFFAATIDPRFSFGLFIPRCHSFTDEPLTILCIIHGTKRQTGGYLSKLQDFCQKLKCALLCPLFPAGIIDPTDLNNYKNILYHDIHFDRILLSMIDQAGRTWNLRTDKVLIHGFSGGGQFVHRFLYLHPERLLGASIGAPGRITPPDDSQPWPHGLGDVSRLFQISLDWNAIRSVPVQVIVGEDDVDSSMLQSAKKLNSAEIEAGSTRKGRAKWLSNSLSSLGISVIYSEIPGVGHDAMKCLPTIEAWLEKILVES